MRKLLLLGMLFALVASTGAGMAQDRIVLIPKPVQGAPFEYNDVDDLFGKAYRWFSDGFPEVGADSLRKLIDLAGIEIDPGSYYIVVAGFTDNFTPIGMFHEDDDFMSTRLFGLNPDNLYYIFISRQVKESFVSVMATSKLSPFEQNIFPFLGLFQSLIVAEKGPTATAGKTTWFDVRQFDMPDAFRKFSDLSFVVKKDLSEDKVLVAQIFDNTSKERWSFGVATGITSVDDVDIIVGSDGRIIVQPKPNRDLAVFGVLNYHFMPVDTKAPRLADSFHLLGGFRIANTIEPILGIGAGVDMGMFGIHLFLGYSAEFANELKDGFAIGDVVSKAENPFKLKVRGKLRYGLEIKFP